MADPHDEQRDDYADAPPRPGTTDRAPAVRWDPRTRRRVAGVLIALAVFGAVGLVLAYIRISEAVRRVDSRNSLLQIGLAIQNYDVTYGELPKNTSRADGTPLLSWRVHLLPFLEEENLYRRFKLDEPWDSPHNRTLLDQMPVVYQRPADRGSRRGHITYYRGFSNPGAAFERRPGDDRPRPDGSYLPMRLTDFRDGQSNTILLVEAGDPVEWTKPDDLDASPGKPFPKMGGMGWRNVFQVVMADTSRRSIRLDCPESTLRALVTHSGGETLPPDWDNR